MAFRTLTKASNRTPTAKAAKGTKGAKGEAKAKRAKTAGSERTQDQASENGGGQVEGVSVYER